MQLIDKKSINFRDIKFLAAAAGKSGEIRYTLQYIYCAASGTAYASDGHRLHVVPGGAGLTPGYWEIIKNNASKVLLVRVDDDKARDFEYPEVGKILATVPSCYGLLPGTLDADFLSVPHTRVVREMDPSVTIQYRYFCDAAPYINEYALDPANGCTPVFFRHSGAGRVAAIMPVKMP